MYEHRYPTKCPGCSANLTDADTVLVTISVADHELEVTSELDPNGVLNDVDRVIENGYHSSTECNECGDSLNEHEIIGDTVNE